MPIGDSIVQFAGFSTSLATMSSSNQTVTMSLFAPAGAVAVAVVMVGAVVSVEVMAMPTTGAITFPARSSTLSTSSVAVPGTAAPPVRTTRTTFGVPSTVAESTVKPVTAQLPVVSASVVSTSSEKVTSSVIPVGSCVRFWTTEVAVGTVVSPLTVPASASANAWPSTSVTPAAVRLQAVPLSMSKARSMRRVLVERV